MVCNTFLDILGEKYDLSGEGYGPLKKCAVISFDKDEEGRVFGKYNGLIVFRHRDSGEIILPGETWVCSLSLNSNLSSKNYFAKPIEKIDASFLFALLADDREEIINAIWENHKDVISPLLEEKFKDVINERIKEIEIKVSNEKESIITELNDSNASLEKKNIENENIIESLQLQIEGLKARAAEVKHDVSHETINQPVQQNQDLVQFKEPTITVNRIGPDTISSEYFTKPRYFVHLTADQRMMVVRPSDKGNVVCINNTIELGGLSFVSNYIEPCEMTSQYNPKYGGVQIYLK